MKRTAITRRPSKRKQAFDAEYAKVLPEVLARGCEFATYALPSDPNLNVIHPWDWACEGRQLGHHAKGRRVADANDPANLRCLCDKHHRFVHAHGDWSRAVGLMISRVA